MQKGVGYNRRLFTTRCNSKMIQDRCIIYIKVEQEVVSALLNGDIAGNHV